MASDDEDGIFKVETVPPPEGESDVYNAPTKVGVLAGSLVEEIVQQARRQAELSAQGRSTPSGSPDGGDGGDEEPAVIDPMKLLAVEQLAAREEAALRPAALPTGLGFPEPSRPDSVPVSADAPPTASSPPRSLDGGAPVFAERAHADVSGAPALPVAVAPVVAPLAAPQPAADEQPVVVPRRSNRLSTVVLLALILALLAFGIYRLRR